MRSASELPLSQEIWLTSLPTSSGELPVYRSQRVNNDAFQVDAPENYRGFLCLWLLLQCRNDEGLSVNSFTKYLPYDIWETIATVCFGDNISQLTDYARCARHLQHLRISQFFKSDYSQPIARPNQVVQAVLHADFDAFCHMVQACPAVLLREGSAIDHTGYRSFRGTPIQALMACKDFSLNEENLSENMSDCVTFYLKQLHPDNWLAVINAQELALLKETSAMYLEKLAMKIATVSAKKEAGETVDEQWLEEAETYRTACSTDLNNDNLILIIHTWLPYLQGENAFDFKEIGNSIKSAKDDEIVAVQNDMAIDSPLAHALKKFDKTFSETVCCEKIVNNAHFEQLLNDFLFQFLNDRCTQIQKIFFWDYVVSTVQQALAACDLFLLADGLQAAIKPQKVSRRSFYLKGDSRVALFAPTRRFAVNSTSCVSMPDSKEAALTMSVAVSEITTKKIEQLCSFLSLPVPSRGYVTTC